MKKLFHKKKSVNNYSFGSIWKADFRYELGKTKTAFLPVMQISTFRTYNYCLKVLKQVIDKRLLYFLCNILSYKVSECVISEKKSPPQQD